MIELHKSVMPRPACSRMLVLLGSYSMCPFVVHEHERNEQSSEMAYQSLNDRPLGADMSE
jgi:hypothetical protein